MATRKSNSADGPDLGDLDGQNGISSGENGDAGSEGNDGSGANDRTIDGTIVTNIGAIGGGDEFVRDDAGNIKRNKDGSPRKKRGRKSGSGSGGNSGQARKGNSKTVSDATDTLSKTLLLVHMGLANVTKFEDFALSEPESRDLAAATVNVLDQFDLQPDPRFSSVVGLISVASMIYAPRIILYKNSKVKKPKNKSADANADFAAALSVVNGTN